MSNHYKTAKAQHKGSRVHTQHTPLPLKQSFTEWTHAAQLVGQTAN